MNNLIYPIALLVIILVLLVVTRVYAEAPTQSPHDTIETKRLASAIKAVENSPRNAIGASGERGIYQISEAVWQDNSQMPFEFANGSIPLCVDETEKVLFKHLSWIYRNVHRLNRPLTVHNVALVYHGGLERFRKNETRWSDNEYANRVLAVYQTTSK